MPNNYFLFQINVIPVISKIYPIIIIDNGASSFVPLSHYLLTNQVPTLLNQLGHELIIHTIITGGQALLDTTHGFSQLVKQFPQNICFVVWLNPYWGKIEREGKSFEQMKIYHETKDRIAALINISDLKKETFGLDLSNMLQQKITFNEAIDSPKRNIMTRQRLKLIRDQLFSQIDNAMVI